MKNANEIIRQMNFRRRLWDKPEIDSENISESDMEDIKNHIQGCLSPENLHRDGEASASQVKATMTMLNGAMRELGIDKNEMWI